MMKNMFGTKGTMTEFYVGEDRRVVTKIRIPKLTVSYIKTIKKDGYEAMQVSFGKEKNHPNKATVGHLKKIGNVYVHLRELPLPEKEPKIGDTITADKIFKVGDVVSVQGTTKGKGFAGTIKRWKFHRGPKTHGQSDRVRAPGSIGQTTEIGRVFKGKKMAGRMGSDTQSSKNLDIVHFDQKLEEIWVSGSVPGQIGGLLKLTITGYNSKLDFLSKPKTEENSSESTNGKQQESNISPETKNESRKNKSENKTIKPKVEKENKEK